MIGIVAGRGAYPVELSEALAAAGKGTAIACLAGQADTRRFPAAAAAREFPLGAISAIAGFFREHGAAEAYLAGGVERRGALRFARPDPWCLSLVPGALFGPDDRLLRSIARRFERLGVRVGDPRPHLGGAIAALGPIAGPRIGEAARRELEIAFDCARRGGARGRGQAAIAFRGRIVAFEDRGGTDALLARAPGPGAVLAKASSPGQDGRFDLPAIGPATIRIAAAVGLAAIGLEAGRSLVLSRRRVAALCGALGVSLVGL